MDLVYAFYLLLDYIVSTLLLLMAYNNAMELKDSSVEDWEGVADYLDQYE